MKLVDEAALRETLVIGEGLDLIDSSLTAALNSATPELEAATLHKFSQGSFIDTFHLYAMAQPGPGLYRATLALSQGFVSGTPVVTRSDNYAGLTSAPETLDASMWRLKAERGGLIIESDTDISNSYVRVAYTAGFAPDGTDADLYDADDVPDWLQEAARMLAASKAVLLNPDLAGGQGGQKRDAKALKESAMMIAESHVRYFPSSIRPI